jgi:hypothetical protein
MVPPFTDTGYSNEPPTDNSVGLSPWGEPPRHADIGYRRIVVRDTDSDVLGKTATCSTEMGLKARGCGELWSAASDEIRDRIDQDEHAGEPVADVWINVDLWTYRIDWLVDDVQDDSDGGLVDKILAKIPGVSR